MNSAPFIWLWKACHQCLGYNETNSVQTPYKSPLGLDRELTTLIKAIALEERCDRFFNGYEYEVVMSLFKSENDSHFRLKPLWLLGSLVGGFMLVTISVLLVSTYV